MSTTLIPLQARRSNGRPHGERAALTAEVAGQRLTNPATRTERGASATRTERGASATRPTRRPQVLHPDTRAPFAVRKGLCLLTNGYRFEARDDDSLYCHTPDGDVYVVNLATGRCSCRATERCSHLISAGRLTTVMTWYDPRFRPEPDWFDCECPNCFAPCISAPAPVGGSCSGRSARLVSCLRGCDPQVIWGEVA